MRLPSLLALASIPALAWNGTGHRICAAITYDHLTPQARARIDDLLRHHPDYATLLTRDSPPEPATRARAAFLAAASWPDNIRNDPRFYDDTKAGVPPTPTLPGFPDMKKHFNWHYIDVPYSPQGVPAKVEPPPTALSEMERILKEPAISAYDLIWLIHMEQDVHQPLHDTSRFLKSQPMGDQGGNLVYIAAEGVPAGRRLYRTLHSIWDNGAGTDLSDAYVTRMAAEFTNEYTATFGLNPKTPKDPKRWIDEGFKLAKTVVYIFGPVTGTMEMPIKLPVKYESNSHKIVRKQIAEAGLRLAALLNERYR